MMDHGSIKFEPENKFEERSNGQAQANKKEKVWERTRKGITFSYFYHRFGQIKKHNEFKQTERETLAKQREAHIIIVGNFLM